MNAFVLNAVPTSPVFDRRFRLSERIFDAPIDEKNFRLVTVNFHDFFVQGNVVQDFIGISFSFEKKRKQNFDDLIFKESNNSQYTTDTTGKLISI